MKMVKKHKKFAFSLIELLIVITVLAILAALTAGIGTRMQDQAKENLTRSTISILASALQQYHEVWDTYPPDCYDETDDPVDEFEDNTGISGSSIILVKVDTNADWPQDDDEPFWSSCGLYFFLSRTARSRALIETITSSMMVTEFDDPNDRTGYLVYEDPDTAKEKNLLYFRDAWKIPLRYRYDPNEGDTVFTIESAGPNKKFGTGDTDDDEKYAHDNITNHN